MKAKSDSRASLAALCNAGILRAVGDDEFVIEALGHRVRTWMGWANVIYSLHVEEDEHGQDNFEIVAETGELGEDFLFASPDVDDAIGWITEQLED